MITHCFKVNNTHNNNTSLNVTTVNLNPVLSLIHVTGQSLEKAVTLVHWYRKTHRWGRGRGTPSLQSPSWWLLASLCVQAATHTGAHSLAQPTPPAVPPSPTHPNSACPSSHSYTSTRTRTHLPRPHKLFSSFTVTYTMRLLSVLLAQRQQEGARRRCQAWLQCKHTTGKHMHMHKL